MTPAAFSFMEVEFTFPDREGWKDILIAELDALGYDSFEETEQGLKAYVAQVHFSRDELQELRAVAAYGELMQISHRPLEPRNWNEVWESAFEPVVISGRCRIRAPFHQSGGEEYELVIQPKMSFGTGHHATTSLMIEYLLDEPLSGQRVLDMGSGTGILAIMAEKRGAREVEAFDIDPWCIENAQENTEANNCGHIRVFLLNEDHQPTGTYDSILANINRNVLLDQLPLYRGWLRPGGVLLLSGFYPSDLETISAAAAGQGLNFKNSRTKDGWLSAKYVL